MRQPQTWTGGILLLYDEAKAEAASSGIGSDFAD